VLSVTGELKKGYFVEFGAMDGVIMSNSYLLETACGWSGIVAEPARRWHPALQRNRKCSVDLRCVWSKRGEQLDFTEPQMAEQATITGFSDWDQHAIARKGGTRYTSKLSRSTIFCAITAPPRPSIIYRSTPRARNWKS
jgi:hypothetical protein